MVWRGRAAAGRAATIAAMFVPQRVLIIVTQQIGDVLLTTPLIAAARARWPQAQVDVLGFEGTLGMLQGNPQLGETIEVRRSAGWRASLAFVRRLWRRYDLALVTQASDRAHLYGWIAARCRSALIPLEGGSRWWKQRLSTQGHAGVPERHTVLEKLQLLAPWMDLAAMPVAVQPPRPQPLPPQLERALRRPCVVVHVPSMWRYKQWPVAFFREVVAGLLTDGVQVVLTGSAGAGDQALVAAVRDVGRAPDLLDVSGQLTLAQVAGLLARADAYLGPDTSITHLAAAVGTPVVALFGPTRPVNWGPWPNGHEATPPWRMRGEEPQRIQRQHPSDGGDGPRRRIVLMQGPSLPGTDCVPCGRAGCEDHTQSRSACLENLPPARVLQELRALLGATPPAA